MVSLASRAVLERVRVIDALVPSESVRFERERHDDAEGKLRRKWTRHLCEKNQHEQLQEKMITTYY